MNETTSSQSGKKCKYLRELGRSQQFQKQKIDALGEMRNVFGAERHGNIYSYLIKPHYIVFRYCSFMIVKTPAITKDYTMTLYECQHTLFAILSNVNAFSGRRVDMELGGLAVKTDVV